jgi:hypothetical protein
LAFPLRCNLFDVNRDRIDKLDIGEREEVLAGVLELYDFIFRALLGSELTGKQGLVFRFLAQFMIVIPGATIRTLRALLTDPTPYLHHLDQLDEDARDFLANHFFADDPEYRRTRREVLRRLFQIFSISPSFGRIFSSDKNAIDFKSAMDSGKVILISTARARLKGEASKIVVRRGLRPIARAHPLASGRSAYDYAPVVAVVVGELNVSVFSKYLPMYVVVAVDVFFHTRWSLWS